MMNFKSVSKKVLFTLVAGPLTLGSYSVFAEGELAENQSVQQSQKQGVIPPEKFNNQSETVAAAITIPPSFTFTNSNHVANGVALRNRTSGTIHLRGVPISSPVVKAFLYWNYSDNVGTGAATSPTLFNGNLITGNKIADNPDPCWGMGGNHTYRSDVTPWVLPSPGHPNQDYQVVMSFNDGTSTTGQNPWSPTESQQQRLEGATLIVVYGGSGKVSIYDNLSGTTMFGGTGTFNLVFFPGSSNGLFTVTGADGQQPGTFGMKDTLFNGSLILESPGGYPANDWNGSAGVPLPQLWDVHTHTVLLRPNAAIQQVSFNVDSDCVVPVAFVLDD